MRARKFLLYGVAIAGFLAGATAADAQSNPGLYTSQVPTASQWNGYFSSKQDYNAALTQYVTNCGTAGVPCLTALGNLGGTPGSTTYLNGAGNWTTPPATAVGANPTATIGATAVNGSATTFMRSDAAPALPATLPALSGVNLTNLNASALASGTVPAGLLPLATTSAFGAVKPDGTTVTISAGVISAAAGVSPANPTATIGATAVNGSATSYMRSDAAPALPATLPALSGVNLTNLNGSNVASGTVPTARLPAGKSVADPGTGVLEALLPIQTSTAASKTFATADLQLETRRSNSGTAMTDTFPASSATGMANGAEITINNIDATATDTVTAGAGTTIGSGSTDIIEAGRSVRYVYDLANTAWRKTLNSGSAGIFNATSGNIIGDIVTMRSIYAGLQDSGTALSSLALNGTGSIDSASPTLTAALINQTFPTHTVNATSLNYALPAASTLQANGGGMWISNPSIYSATLTPLTTDTINGVNSALTLPAKSLTLVTPNGTNGVFAVPASWITYPASADIVLSNGTNTPAGLAPVNGDCAIGSGSAWIAGPCAPTNVANTWSALQRNCITTLSISGSTFTPDGTCNNYKIVLVHASCPCTLANPSVDLSASGTASGEGFIEVDQSSTGGDTITTWGSNYIIPGGTSAISLSAAANAIDVFSIVPRSSSSDMLLGPNLNSTH